MLEPKKDLILKLPIDNRNLKGHYRWPFFIKIIMDINESFKSALERVQSLDTRPSNENLLKIYGLYKQATEGEIKEDRPGGFDFKAIVKYDSWASLRGMSKEDAMKSYIDLVDLLSK